MEKPENEVTPPTPEVEPVPDTSDDERINKAVTARLKREVVKLEKQFDQKLAQALAAQTEAPTPATPPDAYQTKLQQAEKAIARAAEIEREREAEKAEAQKRTDKQAVMDALTKNGVTNVKGAYAYLAHEELVYRDPDEQKLAFKEGDFGADLEAGIKKWLNSDDGRNYMPPKGASGSGAQISKAAASAGMSPAEKKAQGMALLASMLGGKK